VIPRPIRAVGLPVCIVVRGRRNPNPRWWTWHSRRVTSGGFLSRIEAVLGADRHQAALAAGIVAVIDTGLAAVRARWPDAPAITDELGDYFAIRLARQPEVADAVGRLRVEDLFLAWWAGSGDRAGILAFEAAFADDVSRLVARFHKLPADELRQRLRIKLFVGTGTTRPRIQDYSGFGVLQGWLRVTAARAFVDAARSDLRVRYEAELDELDLLGLAAPGGNPRDKHQRAELGAVLKRAFATAVAGLAPRERTFLRHASVDGLTLDQIASTYDVHRATVARTLKSARERLLAETRAGVIAALGIAPDEISSAIAALDSKLDLSLARVLRTAD
jgi:RNA polymerase sigma-70 factor (ECF subfamily)